MEETRRVEVATQLLLQQVAKKEKGIKLETPGVMKRRLKQQAKELGVHYPTLNNFICQLFVYLPYRSFGRKKEQTAACYDELLRLANKEDVANRLLLHLMVNEGVHLKLANKKRQLGQLSQATGISKAELTEFIRPLLHDVVDIVMDLEAPAN